MDGTLTKPKVDFAAIEREIGAKIGFILDYAEKSSPEERARAMDILERFEEQAALKSELNEGVTEILEFLAEKQIKTSLLTRNSRKSVDTVLRKHNIHFEFIVSRDDAKPKPAPDPIFLLSKMMDIHTNHPEELELAKDESAEVGIIMTGENGCMVEGEKVKRVLSSKSAKKIEVAPISQKTDENEQAAFIISAKKKKGAATVKFKARGLKQKAKVSISLTK